MSVEASVEALMQAGIAAARRGDNLAARRHLIEATRLNPNIPEVWFWLGLVLDAPEKQLKCMQRVLELDPNHLHARQAVWWLMMDTAPSTPTPPFPPHEATAPAPPVQETPASPTEAGRSNGADQVGRPATVRHIAAERSKPQPGLLRAWAAALVFDGKTAYHACRNRASAFLAAVLMMWIVVAAVLVWATLPLAPTWAQLDIVDWLRFVGETFFYGLGIAVQVVAALLVASWVAAYVGRRWFGSDVSAARHFGLSGLWYVPAGLVMIVLGTALWLAANVLGVAVVTVSAPYTVLVGGVYLLAQMIYSNARIHRVRFGAATVIAGVMLLSAGLVLVWLFPLTTAP